MFLFNNKQMFSLKPNVRTVRWQHAQRDLIKIQPNVHSMSECLRPLDIKQNNRCIEKKTSFACENKAHERQTSG